MSLNTRPRSPPPSIWGVRIGHNGGLWHDGPPQGARPCAEEEEESQGGRRTPPKKEEPREKASLRRSDGSVAPQPPKRALGCCRRSRVCASSPRRWLPGLVLPRTVRLGIWINNPRRKEEPGKPLGGGLISTSPVYQGAYPTLLPHRICHVAIFSRSEEHTSELQSRG